MEKVLLVTGDGAEVIDTTAWIKAFVEELNRRASREPG